MTAKLIISFDVTEPNGSEITYETKLLALGAQGHFEEMVIGSIEDVVKNALADILHGHEHHSCKDCKLMRCPGAGLSDEERSALLGLDPRPRTIQEMLDEAFSNLFGDKDSPNEDDDDVVDRLEGFFNPFN